MALKFEELKLGEPLKKLEGEPVKIPVPDDLPELKPKPPKILSEAETHASYAWFNPVRHVYDDAKRQWIVEIDVSPTQPVRPQISTESLTDDSLFVETQNGVFSVRNGKTKQQITNACIRIVRVKLVWYTEKEYDTFLICRVMCKDAWGDETNELEIEQSDYKNIFKKIHRK